MASTGTPQMSRNLAQRGCHQCNSSDIQYEEGRRLITPAEAGVYYDEYYNLVVCNAHCAICGTKYLAWFNYPKGSRANDIGQTHVDLSYRSTFNDEPGEDDVPTKLTQAQIDLDDEELDDEEERYLAEAGGNYSMALKNAIWDAAQRARALDKIKRIVEDNT